jgi:RNA polymerase sigma factor (sigma-70 family)
MPQPVLTDVLRHLGRMCQAPDGDPLTDADLLRRFIAERDQTAFTLLVERHGPMVLGACRRILGELHGAEDCFQATFLVLARRADAIRKRESMASWLYGVATRIAVRARHKARADAAAHLRRQPEVAAMQQQPLDALTWQELRTALDEEIARLPEKHRAPIVLCYFEDKSHAQAADELGWPKRSLTSRIARARELLHRRLLERGIALSAGALATVLCDQAAAARVGALLTINTVKTATGALTGNAVTLAEEVLRQGPWLRGKLALVVIAVGLVMGSIGLAALGVKEQPPAGPEPQPQVAADETRNGAELYEEPLPQGALARLGTTRFRLGNYAYAMALMPDGRTALAVGGNQETQFWDVRTGRAIRKIPWKQGGGGRVAACSPDGRLAASIQDMNVLHLWDAATGKELAKEELDLRLTTGLAFAPDSATLAVGGGHAVYGVSDKTSSTSVLTLWRWNGTRLQSLWSARPDHEAPLGSRSHHIQAPAFSPDGKQLATGGGNNTIIRIWDVADGKEIHQFKTSGTRVGAVAFAPAARTLASGSDDGQLTLWDPADGSKRWEHKLPGEVRALAFAPDGKTLAAGGGPEYGWRVGRNNEPFLTVLDAGTGKNAQPIRIERDGVASVAFSKDGTVLAAALGGTLRFWDPATGKDRFAPCGHEHWIGAVAVAQDGRRAVTAGGDGLLILWDLATGREERRLIGHRGEVRAAAFVPGGILLASAGTDQTVRLWQLDTGEEVHAFDADPKGLLYSVAASGDGRLLAAGDYYEGYVHIWDRTDGKQLHKLRTRDQRGSGVLCLAFAPDGKTLAAGETALNSSRAGGPTKARIILWDAVTGHKQGEIPAHDHTVNSLTFSPDGTMIASTGWSDKVIAVWDATLGTKLLELPCGSGNSIVAFSPGGRTLAWGGAPEAGIALYEVRSRKVRQQFAGHVAYVHSFAFTPDGRKLVSASMDTTGIVWDLTGRRKPADANSARDLWQALASPDAVQAGRAIWSLAATPQPTIALLAQKLREAPSIDAARMRKLVAELDGDDFDARQAAQKQLEAVGKHAEPALRQALTQRPSVELRRRIEGILGKREVPTASPDVLQVLRGIEVLEHIGSPEARRALEQFAEQTADDYFRHEARAAIERLARCAAP